MKTESEHTHVIQGQGLPDTLQCGSRRVEGWGGGRMGRLTGHIPEPRDVLVTGFAVTAKRARNINASFW